MFFYRKLDKVKLESEKRKGFDIGKEKMRELKNREIKKLKNRFYKERIQKDEEIKERDKRIKEIEKFVQNFKYSIVAFKNHATEISMQTDSTHLQITKEKAIADRRLSEIEAIERTIEKEYSKIIGKIEDYKFHAKLN
jgi:hypothetical protein